MIGLASLPNRRLTTSFSGAAVRLTGEWEIATIVIYVLMLPLAPRSI